MVIILAILTNPLFSDEARGTVAKCLTFRRSAVHPVASFFNEHPVNWTSAKVAHAFWWKQMCNQWRALPWQEQAAWDFVSPGCLTGFNYFMQCKGIFPEG